MWTLTQHACASALLAVDVAGRLLAADRDPDALALVLTGEKAFSPGSRLIEGTTIMGEGTAAVLVAADGAGGVAGQA
ncbi:MAG: 3-oxoacyl-ACP synthase, partial [Cellulosimicrobium sp.]|nr:3-oxoacyl-ACP synthase [Cellulosimicrobium sp.]